MKAWWESLNIREQLLLAAVAGVAVFVLIDMMIVEQYRVRNQQLVEQIEQSKEDLDWMRLAVLRLPETGKQTAKPIPAGRVVSYINQQITRQGLKNKMLQMTPIKDHSVRLRLQDVSFEQLLNFFSSIDGAVVIGEVRILPAEQVGYVSASLVVSNGKQSS